MTSADQPRRRSSQAIRPARLVHHGQEPSWVFRAVQQSFSRTLAPAVKPSPDS